MSHTFLLRARRGFAMGDVVLVTALARDIQRHHGPKYKIMVDTNWSNIWGHNPRVTTADYSQEHQLIDLSYVDGIISSKRGERRHYLTQLHRDFQKKSCIHVPVYEPRGEIFLTQEEKRPLVQGRYWLILAGGKLDMTTKHWVFSRYQELVGSLQAHGVRLVQAGAVHQQHVHPPLEGVLNLVGHTEDVRKLCGLIYHAEGVICGVTGAMHLAAVFERPCVVIAGGREEPWWEHYGTERSFGPECAKVKVSHRFLHTLGELTCCQERGCWKARTVPLDERDQRPGANHLCLMPGQENNLPVPECMKRITVAQVTQAVLSYYQEGALPPPDGRDISLVSSTLVSKPQAREQRMPPTPLAPISKKVSKIPSLSHAILGGKITLGVLCYGNHPDLARRCLESIRRSVPAENMDLRVLCNSCSPETMKYLLAQPIQKIYLNTENKLKYPAMRALLYDKDYPITTNYLVWFDDDSFVVKDTWLEELAQVIVNNHHLGCRLYGAEFLHDFSTYAGRPDLWFKQAPWYKGRDFFAGKQGRFLSPNGATIRFVSGGFWAAEVRALREAQAPDERVKHHGGDITIGAQLHQLGHKTMSFNKHKEHVHSSGAQPRGLSRVGKEKHLPWQEGGEML